jgi:hypothetical protein
MTASLSFYDSFKANLGATPFDMNSDTFKLMLVSSSYTFSAAHTQKSDITNELSTANGYTAGGATLSNLVFSQTSGTAKWDADDVSWTASGGSLVFRRGVIYNDTTAGDLLVCSILFDTTPADITVLSGNTFTVQWNASGIFTLA